MPGLKEVEVAEDQEEYATEAGALVAVAEDEEGGLQELRNLLISPVFGAHI